MSADNIFAKFERFIQSPEVTELGLSPEKTDFILLSTRRMVHIHDAIENSKNPTRYNPEKDQPQNYAQLAKFLKHKYLQQNGGNKVEAAESAKQEFLKLISVNPKIYPLTGHPTEILASNGVNARDDLRENIIEDFRLLKGSSVKLTENVKKSVLNFIENAAAPTQPKTIGQERRDAKHASEKFFDSIKHERASVRSALRGIDADDNIDGYELNLVKVAIWTYDNDGKPELRPAEMHSCAYMMTSSILAKYTNELAGLALETKDQNLKDHCYATMFKLINTININIDKERAKKEAKEKTETEKVLEWAKNLQNSDSEQEQAVGKEMEKAYKLWKKTESFRHNLEAAQIPDEFEGYSASEVQEMQARSAEARTLHREKIKNSVPNIGSTHALSFSNEEDLKKSIFGLRDLYLASNESKEVKERIGDICEAANDFGMRAARGEYRQSVKVYGIAFKYLEKFLANKIDAKGPEAIMNFLAQNDEKAKELGILVRQEAARIRELPWFKTTRENAGKEDVDINYRLQFYFADLIEKLEIVNKDPESCPVILGAEFMEVPDAFKMASLYSLASDNNYGKVTVAPLVEYEKAVVKWEAMEAELKGNANYMKLIGYNHGLMLAGSDANKTMGSGNAYYTQNAFYIGTGSAPYRNAIPYGAIPKRTVQGIEHGDMYDQLIAFENEQTRVARIRRDIGAPELTRISDAEAVTNVGNRLGLKTNDAEISAKLDERIKSYSAKYRTFMLNHYMEHFTQKEVEAANSYAARPQKRPEYALPEADADVESAPKSWLDVETPLHDVRAIGNGQRARNKFGTLILLAEISDMCGTNEVGLFNKKGLDKAVELYRTNPLVQDIINRAVIDISQNQSKTSGWEEVASKLHKLLGTDVSVKRVIEKNGTASVFINNEKFAFAELLDANNHDGRNRLAKLLQGSSKLAPEENGRSLIAELTMGICGAVMHDWESIKAPRTICQIFGRMNNCVARSATPEAVLEQLEKINPTYAKELIFTRECTNKAQVTMITEPPKSARSNAAHMVARTGAELMPGTLLTATLAPQRAI